MLLAMTYNVYILISLGAGHGLGYFLVLQIEKTKARKETENGVRSNDTVKSCQGTYQKEPTIEDSDPEVAISISRGSRDSSV